MKNLTSILLLSAFVATMANLGCTTAVPVIAKPPLPPKPLFTSMKVDRNDMTGQLGAWMNEDDLRTLALYIASVEAVRETWK